MATAAINNPVTKRSSQREIHAGSEYLGATPDVVLGDSPRGDVEEIVTDVNMGTAAMDAFMNEIVTVMMTSSGDEHEVPYVQVGVNGRMVVIPREEPVNLRRSYLEVLARAKRTDYDQNIDVRLGESMNRLTQKNSLKYPFTVIHDPNPKGAQWLKEILSQRR